MQFNNIPTVRTEDCHSVRPSANSHTDQVERTYHKQRV